MFTDPKIHEEEERNGVYKPAYVSVLETSDEMDDFWENAANKSDAERGPEKPSPLTMLFCLFSYHVQTDANYLLSDGYRPL